MSDCFPFFHNLFPAATNQIKLSSGCSLNSTGNVGCSPESMRADAEHQLSAAGYLSSLDLETYTLARYMQSEVGGGTVEERVAVGEAARNRARSENIGINDLLLYRQPVGHPNRGFYGPIHGIGTGVSTAPYGRWAATSADPTVQTALLADLVTSGKSANFSRGAIDQDGPEYWAGQGQASLNGYVQGLAKSGQYWVGPLPGVDHWHTFLQFEPGISSSTVEAQALIARGMQALTLPVQRPQWPADLPICMRPISLGWVAAIGVFLGALAFHRGWRLPWAKKLTT
jgi:hypothetical protein